MNYMSAEYYMRLLEFFYLTVVTVHQYFPLYKKKIKKNTEYINNKIISIPLQTFFDY